MVHDNPRPRRDAKRTRSAILEAAQEAFSIKGYSEAGVREITAAAGVNPALVNRYFGSKERLYEAALSALLDAQLITNIPREEFGGAVVSMLTADQRNRRNPLPMMMLASADPTARAITVRLLKEIFLAPLAHWYGAENGAGKAALLKEIFLAPLAHWYGAENGAGKAACFAVLASGLTVYHEVYPLAALGSEMRDKTRDWLIACFQSLMD